MESKLIECGIDRAKYHGGDLEGTSIVRMFQNSNEIFNQFKISMSKSISEDVQINEVNDVTERYIEICTLFDTLFFFIKDNMWWNYMRNNKQSWGL